MAQALTVPHTRAPAVLMLTSKSPKRRGIMPRRALPDYDPDQAEVEVEVEAPPGDVEEQASEAEVERL